MLTRLGLRLAVWRMAYMYCVLDSHSIVVVVEYRIKYYRIGSTFTTTTQPCISWPLHTISLVSPLLRTHPHSPMSTQLQLTMPSVLSRSEQRRYRKSSPADWLPAPLRESGHVASHFSFSSALSFFSSSFLPIDSSPTDSQSASMSR